MLRLPHEPGTIAPPSLLPAYMLVVKKAHEHMLMTFLLLAYMLRLPHEPGTVAPPSLLPVCMLMSLVYYWYTCYTKYEIYLGTDVSDVVVCCNKQKKTVRCSGCLGVYDSAAVRAEY